MTTSNHFFSLPPWLRQIADDPFQKYLYIFLSLLGLLLIALPQKQPVETELHQDNTIHFFFHPTCPHCREQKEFNRYLAGKYPQLKIIAHDTSLASEAKLFHATLKERNLAPSSASIPITIVGLYTVIGFKDAATTGLTLEKAVTAFLDNDHSLFTQEDEQWLAQDSINIPWFGSLHPSDFSLPVLTAIIGLADGFNPCAMWVLVYLISLIISIGDRIKIWLLVGSFVLASGILYFLFMTAWLNVFLLIGYVRPLTIIIGMFAMGAGILNIKNFILTHGSPVCSIGDGESKKKTMGRVETIIRQPLSVATISGIIALAFIVNSIEFACSAALPAIYTHILTLQHLSTPVYYGYILLYVLFFMLDDLIIFSLAALAMTSSAGQRYAQYCTILGGIVLLLLGMIMAFQPNLLR